MINAIEKAQQHDSQLTSIHSNLLQVCLLRIIITVVLIEPDAGLFFVGGSATLYMHFQKV